MATLQAAVEAVSGVTWLSGAPVVATVGNAWDDGGFLYVILEAPRPARPGYTDPVIAASTITSALAAVPGYSASAATEDLWSFDGRQVTVGTWVPSSALTDDPTAPTPTAGDADTSVATTAFVTSAVAAQASTDSGTYAAIRRPFIGFVGDSITFNAGVLDGSSNPSPRYECRAWMEWARAINGARWSRVGPATQYGWASAGYTTDQMIAAEYHTQAAASSAAAIAVLAGTNDLASKTSAYVYANLQTIWAPSLAAGKIVLACLLLPRSDQIAKVDAVNLLIRQACATTKNLVLVDMYGAMVNPSTGAPLTTRSNDGVHPDLSGAAAMGQVFAQVVDSVMPAGSPPDVRIEASADQITRNPFGLGDVSGLPTNWAKYNLGSGSAVATKAARTDVGGEWTNLVVTSAAPNADGIQLQVAQPSAKWAIGDTLVAVAEVDITAGYDLRGLMLYAYGNASTAQAYWGYRSASDGAALTAGAPVSGRMWLVTPVWTVPATATGSMTVNLQIYGPGTIRVGRFGIVRV